MPNFNQVATFVGGVFVGSLVSSLLLSKSNNNNKKIEKQHKVEDFQSENYRTLKNEQLARIIKFFGEDKFIKL